MGPEKGREWCVGIGLVIAMLMVHTMDGDPASWTILQIADTENGEGMFKPFGADESAMGEEAMIADGDPKHAEGEVTGDGDEESGPREEPGDEG